VKKGVVTGTSGNAGHLSRWGGLPAIWKPAVNTTWQWQLDTLVDLSYSAEVYDIDMFDNGAGVVAALHTQGCAV
jgi:hypothetical protein